jgi:hypothetical protein
VAEHSRSLQPAANQQLALPIDSKTQASTVSWFLFGGVAMIMMVFYLVSYQDKDIVDGTWLVLSNAISLFCAVLLFLSFRDLTALATDGEEVRRLAASDDWGQCWNSNSDRRLVDIFWTRRLAGAPTQKSLAVDAFCVLFMFAMWESILFAVRRKPTLLSALGLIGAHCIGFSTLYTFGNMQQCEPFRETPGLSLVIVIMAIPALALMTGIGGALRLKLAGLLGADVHEGSVHNFIHQCLHTEREASAFAVSFLLAQVLQYVATQNLAPLHAVPKGRDLGNAVAEFCFAAGLAVSVVVAGFLEHAIAGQHGHDDLSHDDHHGHEMSRSQLFMHMLKDTLAFTAGWTLLHAIKLCFWSATDDRGILGEGDVMTSHVVIVFFSSAITFIMFFAVDYSADRIHGLFARGLRALGKAFMLLLGLAWEGAFWEGAHSMSAGMELEDKTSRMLAVIFSSLAFCAIVMPAWIMYIVPHTIVVKDEEIHVKDYDDHEASPCGEHKTISLSHIFSFKSNSSHGQGDTALGDDGLHVTVGDDQKTSKEKAGVEKIDESRNMQDQTDPERGHGFDATFANISDVAAGI